MDVALFAGDLVDADADAICTSTNPRLSLMMGTGGAVRARGGFAILRECEALVAAAGEHGLPAGSAHATTAGALPYRMVIHCVASDGAHRSSEEIIRSCVRKAIGIAGAAGCRSIAMPLFATGHAHVSFALAVRAMAAEIGTVRTGVGRVVVVVFDHDRVDQVLDSFRSVLGGEIGVTRSAVAPADPPSWWSPDS